MIVWKPIIRFEMYAVSSLGDIRRIKDSATSKASSKNLAHSTQEGHYPVVTLCRDGKKFRRQVHSLVARAFLGETPPGYEINHKDGNKSRPLLSNLEFITRLDNNLHARVNGLCPIGEEVKHAKLTMKQVLEIRRRYVPRIVTQEKLALEYKVSRGAIDSVLRGKSWSLALSLQEQQPT